MKNSASPSEIAEKLPEWMHFSPDGPGIWVGSRKYFRQDEVFHEHEFYELVLVRSGSGLHVTEEGEYPIRARDLLLIKPGSAHGYRQMKRLEIVNILYIPERLKFERFDLADNFGFHALFFPDGEISDDYRFRNNLSLSVEQMDLADEILRELEREQYLQRPGWVFSMNINFMRLVLLFSRAVTEEGGVKEPLNRIAVVLQYIHRHGAGLQPADIAAHCNLSLRTLERLFVSTMRTTPAAYLVHCRLKQAAALLVDHRELNITQIAVQCGFCDGNHLSKQFRRKYGQSPRDYRRRFSE